MGQQQLLLTVAAIVIFGISSVAVNQNMLRQSDAIYQQQATFFATAVAQQYIEEAKLLAYDENTITNSTANFTPPGSLGGPDADDVDDFEDDPTVTLNDPIAMTVDFDVRYVKDDLTDASAEKAYKKLTVTVNSPYLINPVTAEYIFGYHKNH